MHPEHKLVDEIVNKYKFKGWLTNQQVTKTSVNTSLTIFQHYMTIGQ